MPNFKIQVREGITTGTLYKTAIIEADSKEEAHKMLLEDGCEGPKIDWDEDYDDSLSIASGDHHDDIDDGGVTGIEEPSSTSSLKIPLI